MPARVYYNEHDPQKAAWLRELIRAGVVAAGDVDERSIADVHGSDLAAYTQCHFFAGIGVWSYALFNAGWADSDPVWTGSCPCQPFSQAGRQRGVDDARHLWPEWLRLIGERRPGVVFGEQVASPLGRSWLDAVSIDLEGLDYAVGSADLCAAGVGAPHIRQRLYFVADADSGRFSPRRLHRQRKAPEEWSWRTTARPSDASGMADAGSERREGERVHLLAGESGQAGAETTRGRSAGVLADTTGARPQGRFGSELRERPDQRSAGKSGPLGGFWRDADWLPCRDGKARPVEPGTFPLAHGAPARVLRLRGYGDAIVSEVAQAYIEAYLDVRGGVSL